MIISHASTAAAPTPSVVTTGPNVRPGEKPPVLDAIGRTNTPAGGLEFAAYWMRSLDWAYATASSALARSLYAPSCTGCTRFLDNIIDYTSRHGQHFRGGRSSVESTSIEPNDQHNGSNAVIDVTINQQPLQVVSSAGKALGSAKGVRNGRFRVWIRWSDASWTVVDWKQVIVK